MVELRGVGAIQRFVVILFGLRSQSALDTSISRLPFHGPHPTLPHTMKRLYLFLACTFGLLFATSMLAQQPGEDFIRTSFFDATLALPHSNIQPAAVGLDTNYYQAVDAMYHPPASQRLQLQAFGSLASGFDRGSSNHTVSPSFAGLDAQWQPNQSWFAQAGYALAGGFLPNYMASTADQYRFIPGYGYAIQDNKTNLYHAHYTFGKIAFCPSKHFQFEAGKGKHFWGDGHRSLILSDNAAPAPYFRITTSFWKLRYTNLWMQLRDISLLHSMQNARIKYSALHALSYDVTRKLNVSLYEMVVWQDRDSMSRRTLDMGYLNPLIFYRPVEYALGSPDNVIIAASFKWHAFKRLQFYGQFVLDEFNLKLFKKDNNWWGNKIGGQLGLKWQPHKKLYVNSEINAVRPFTYTHGSAIQSWTHLNQPMAHPLGANFLESTNRVVFTTNSWKLEEQINASLFGRDYDANADGVADNFGGDIIRSYKNPYGGPYGHELLQGELHKVIYHSLTISHAMRSKSRMEIFINHTLRMERSNTANLSDHYVMIGIRTLGLLQPVQDY